MTEIPPEPLPEPVVEVPPTYSSARPEKASMSSGDIVSIIAIVSICVVALCCIGSCALIGFAFMKNPPW